MMRGNNNSGIQLGNQFPFLNQNQRQPQLDPTEDLLHNSLFPALRKLDKGIKKKDLNQFPTEEYHKGEN